MRDAKPHPAVVSDRNCHGCWRGLDVSELLFEMSQVSGVK